MRVLIFGDMEGVSGIVHWDQVNHASPMYQEGRRLYTEELNAAVRGARAAGAREIVVVDSHGAGAAGSGGGPAFNSLIPELIDPDCEFVTHHGWANYTEMLESGCDAAMFVGVHSRAGTPGGVLSHTIATLHWLEIAINDEPVGEIGVVAALCGHFGVPMALVTGDDKACEEARALLGGNVYTMAVKRGLSRFSARHIPPVRARRLIEEKAREAIENAGNIAPYIPPRPTTIRMEIVTADNMDKYRRIEGIKIIEPRTVISKGKDFLTAWKKVAPY